MNEYLPDSWVIVATIDVKFGNFYRVLCSYTDPEEESWRLSSPITGCSIVNGRYEITTFNGKSYSLPVEARTYRMVDSVKEKLQQLIKDSKKTDHLWVYKLEFVDALKYIENLEECRSD